MNTSDTGKLVKKDSAIREESKSVQSVERALLIIETLADYGKPMNLGDIAAQVNLKPSTVHRLLGTLMVRDFVDQDEHSRYKLAMKLFYIGNAATYAMDIRKFATPFMRDLLERCNETVNLAVWDQGEVVYIDQLESNNIVLVRMSARVGSRAPAYCTGSGKVLLSGLSQEEIFNYLSRTNFVKFTSDTIVNPVMLSKELEKVRQDGLALDLGEHNEGVRCAAVPIKNTEGQVVAALSVSGPSMRMTTSYINNELTPMVKEIADCISHKMGYQQNNNLRF